MQPNYNKILIEPIAVMPRTNLSSDENFASSNWLINYKHPYSDYTKDSEELKNKFGYCVEFYIRQLISQCAIEVSMPYVSDKYLKTIDEKPIFKTPKQLLGLYSPSIRKRIKLLDSDESIWDNIRAYFSPLEECLISENNDCFHPIYEIEWYLFMLVLAIKNDCQVKLSQEILYQSCHSVFKELESLNSTPSRESKSRMAVLYGIFNLFDQVEEIPCLKLSPRVNASQLKERIDEILEDSYLLEASFLRRLLSVQANKAAIKRDLRKLSKTIIKLSPWAKGITSTGIEPAIIGVNPSKIVSGIADIIKGDYKTENSPMIFSTAEYDLKSFPQGYINIAQRFGDLWGYRATPTRSNQGLAFTYLPTKD